MNKVVITGGTGFIGRLLVAKYLEEGSTVVSVSRRWQDAEKLLKRHNNKRLTVVNCDIRNQPELEKAFAGASLVIHAAAYKSVVLGSISPSEVVSVNVDGTTSVMNAARIVNVPKVIAISSDKACSPANIYGATKLLMEMIVTSSTSKSTKASVVRYGNVLWSTGSVFPIWLESSDPYLRNPSATRYWFRPQDAVRFICLAAENMNGGEIFLPLLVSSKMDTARRAFETLFNRTIRTDDKGLEAGEKMHEQMIVPHEISLCQPVNWSSNVMEISRRKITAPVPPYAEEMLLSSENMNPMLDYLEVEELLAESRTSTNVPL